jgi:hypothetical protein
MDSVQLGSLSGMVMSLAFSYVPGLSGWYAAQTAQKKSVVMLVILALCVAGIVAVSCNGWYDVGVVCDKVGLVELAKVFMAVLVANQATYVATRRL